LEKRTLREAVMRVVFLRKTETKTHKRGTSLAGRWERRFYPPLRNALLTLQNRIQIAPIARAIVEANVEQVIAAARVDNVRDIVAAFAAELPEAVRAGGEQAARELGITHKAVIRKQVFDLGRPHIAAWLYDHAGELLVQITDKSREAVRRVIEDGVLNGRHPTQMAKDVKKVVGLHRRQADAVLRRRKALEAAGVPATRVQEISDKYAERLLNQRARVIARNESLVAVNRGRYALWNQLVEDGALDAAQEQRWDTAADEGVCEICGPMNGQRRKLNEPFTTGTGGIVDHPPAHVQCLPPGCVIGNARAVAAMRRVYDGELVHIDTAFGPRLSVTPNHPILTRRGMVSAKLLQHGDDVLYAPSRDGVAPLVDPDGQALPFLVEEVFDSLGFSGSMKFAHMASSPVQFHGDGSSNGHVDVVRADGSFGLAQPNLFELLSSHGFRSVPVSHVGVTSFHGLVHNIETTKGWYTAHGIVTSNCRCVAGLV
jgi:hypothetical protein